MEDKTEYVRLSATVVIKADDIFKHEEESVKDNSNEEEE